MLVLLLEQGPDAARAYPYTVEVGAGGAAVKIAAPDHPLAQAAAKKNPALAKFIAECKRHGTAQEIIDKVKQGMTDNGAHAEVEIYPGTHHGFAFPKRPVYHRDAAERHWERLVALYRRNLSS